MAAPRALLALPMFLASFSACIQTGSLSDAPDPTSLQDPVRWTPEEWRAALTKPIFSGITSSIHYLSAEDGTRLSLSLHLPAGLTADAQIPTLLQLTPYQSIETQSTPAGITRPAASWSDFVLRGAAYVAADARGTNGSEGCLDFGGSKDRADARAFVHWIRSRPWSNGVVVSDGISHPGMGSVVLHAAVPDLTAALAHAPVVSYYQDEWLQGAKFEDQINGPAYQGIELLPAFYADPEALKAQAATCTGQTTADFSTPEGTFTPLWADRDLSRHAPDAQAPILLTHGFVDQNVHPDHFQLYWDALPPEFPKYAILGWWYHGWPDMNGHAAKRFLDLRQRWLDATLFGAPNGLFAEPRLLVEDSKGRWHEGHDWPLEPSETVTLHATSDGGLTPGDAAEGKRSYVDRAAATRGVWRDASAVFRTEPLAHDRLVNGAPVVRLVASSSEAETKWVAYLFDEAPDGKRQRISHGYADSHTLNGEARWQPMTPGQPYTWHLHLMPTAVVVDTGHRIVLVVASQDSRTIQSEQQPCHSDYRGGCYRPSGIQPSVSAGRATNTVHTGPDGTRVEFAWVDSALTQKPPWPA